jgi:hypothetical protein
MSESDAHPFVVGAVYQNRRWKFEVLSIDGDNMSIRTHTGEEKIVSCAQQAKFLRTIQRDSEETLESGNF